MDAAIILGAGNACYPSESGDGVTIFTVRHITTYQYKEPVSFGEHRMMLRPREDQDQRVLELELQIHAEPSQLALEPGCLRQPRRHRAFLRPGLGASLRERCTSRSRSGRLPRSPYREFCPQLSVRLRGARYADLTRFIDAASPHPRLNPWAASFFARAYRPTPATFSFASPIPSERTFKQ